MRILNRFRTCIVSVTLFVFVHIAPSACGVVVGDEVDSNSYQMIDWDKYPKMLPADPGTYCECFTPYCDCIYTCTQEFQGICTIVDVFLSIASIGTVPGMCFVLVEACKGQCASNNIVETGGWTCYPIEAPDPAMCYNNNPSCPERKYCESRDGKCKFRPCIKDSHCLDDEVCYQKQCIAY